MSIQIIGGIELRLNTLWDFYFEDTPESRFLVVTTSLPFFNLDTETRDTGAKHYSNFNPEEGFSITFNETNDFQVYEYFKEWRDKHIFDPETRRFRLGNHTKNAILAFQSYNKGKLEYIKAFKFDGILFKGMEDFSLNYTDSANQQITVSFAVNEIYEISPNQVEEI